MKLNFSKATKGDLPEIVALLVDDKLGRDREICNYPLDDSYYRAFDCINSSTFQELYILKTENEAIGTFQLSFMQYLTYRGGLRAQVEAVRVKSEYRGKGVGKSIFAFIINRCKEKNCHMIQLTTDNARPEALHFYKSLGFKASHTGLKLHL